MSNRAHLNTVKFEYLNGNVLYGYTISDDYEMTYDNNAEAIIEDDIDLLKYAIKTADDVTDNILTFIFENEKGIFINDEWYPFEKIKDILKEN